MTRIAPAALLLLSACGSSAMPEGAMPSARETSVPAGTKEARSLPATTKANPTLAQPADGSCRAEIGLAAAERLVERCVQLSPATRPPCHIANSCELIRAEIERSEVLIAQSDGVATLRRYAEANSEKDYAAAYALWDGNGRASGQTLAAFRRGFARTASTRVWRIWAEDGGLEGATGPLYVTVPVTVEATLTDGTEQRFRGRYVLRRRNGPSDPVQDRDWRIHSADLRQVD